MQSCRAAVHRSLARDLPADQRRKSEKETRKQEKMGVKNEQEQKNPASRFQSMLLLGCGYANTGSERRYRPLLT